jgi:hypothetical protein
MPGFVLPQGRIIADDMGIPLLGSLVLSGWPDAASYHSSPCISIWHRYGLSVGCAVWGRLEGLLAAVERLTMQDPASGLLRIHLLRGWVNKGDEEGRSPLGPQPRFR